MPEMLATLAKKKRQNLKILCQHPPYNSAAFGPEEEEEEEALSPSGWYFLFILSELIFSHLLASLTKPQYHMMDMSLDCVESLEATCE